MRDANGEGALSNQDTDDDTTRATARLPNLEIEIVHRRSPAADAEQISIHLRAVPSFEAFGQFLQMASPFGFWAQAAQLVWLPWLQATSALMLPGGIAAARPKLDAEQSESGTQRRSRA